VPKREFPFTKKNFLCETSVTFAGYNLSRKGYKIDSSLLKAISYFPVPTNITDLRSFFGLANQLSSNTDQIAKCLQPLRSLLSSKNKFTWGTDHSKAFELAKKALSDIPTLAFFDVKRPTRVMTDASNKGIGLVLQQKQEENWHLIQAGSRF